MIDTISTKFKVGTHVICRERVGNSGLKNQAGTIIDYGANVCCVQFNNYIDGHGGAGAGKPSYCWYVNTDKLELIIGDGDWDE